MLPPKTPTQSSPLLSSFGTYGDTGSSEDPDREESDQPQP